MPGVTSESVIKLARDKMGMEVEERRISVREALEADELFCAGTAAIVAPIGSINYKGKDYFFVMEILETLLMNFIIISRVYNLENPTMILVG